ncbi:MAG: ABC transporter ATP-binding protein [Bacteroidales bacterium]|nr:ABC transporter ATP-binding protein [Bacteroidales bacterium]
MTAIEFNNISKLYRLGLVGTGTLSHDLKRWWTMNIRGKEDPYLTIGETNDRSSKGDSDYVWALKDIDFKVEQGDVVGIIGKNGAGKSTLLKILSKVTAPTTGTIRARGRIGSLLEVGTGFHPEMTGRENIYMNGAILGMTKQEITKKLDEIVDFSGCERYIDTPVKRYSSGMMVRLGFAVAAHLDPEILVVDEVLAVGDAEFQKKAIGKMQDVSRGEGRTVLFVSHNMSAVRKLCRQGIVLKNGSIDFIGNVNGAVDYYIDSKASDTPLYMDFIGGDDSKEIEFLSVRFAEGRNTFSTNEPISFVFKVHAHRDIPNFRINTTIYSMDETAIGSVSNTETLGIKNGEEKEVLFSLNDHHLAAGKYTLAFSIGIGNHLTAQRDFDYISNVLSFSIENSDKDNRQESAISLWDSGWGHIIFKANLKYVKS